jgi:hypothetical protein
LGFNLRIDGRGFAWFHFDGANSNVNSATRQLALLFMLVFELKADEGLHLARFTDWLIDRELLAALFERSNDLLLAEGLDEQNLVSLFERACNYGFAESSNGGWQLLPAVWRYLDHFESLASAQLDDDDVLVERGTDPRRGHHAVEGAAAGLEHRSERLVTALGRGQVGDDLGVAQVDADDVFAAGLGQCTGCGADPRRGSGDDDRAHDSSWFVDGGGSS